MRTIRPLFITALMATAVLAAVLVGRSPSKRTFSATVPAAVDLLHGQEINAGGVRVGRVVGVEPIHRGRAARVQMEITDGDYWPLPRDSKLDIRFGGTVSFTNRYLLLIRGKDRAHMLSDGDELPAGAVKTPVEIDRFIADFPADTRRDLGRLLQRSAPVLEQGGPALHQALEPRKVPLVATGLARLTADLTKDSAGLRTLVRSTSRVLRTADAANPGLRTLLEGFAGTADAIASEGVNLKTTLSRFPAALRQTRKTLGNAEVTLREAGGLMDRLRPGVTSLRATVRPLHQALLTVRDVAPIGVRALDQAKSVRPAVHTLNQLTHRVPLLTSLFDQAASQLACLRPYSPEIAHFGEVWGDFHSSVDSRDRITRANVGAYLPAAMNSIPYTAGEAARAFPGLRYAFPNPPGNLVDQPWFQPGCGITKDTLDPDKDPESAYFVRQRAKEQNK